jgi:hypothetical protein
MLLLPVFLVAVVALIIGAAAPDSSASGYHHWRPEVSQFDEFEVFIEINATDLDAGLQGKLDGDAWNYANVKGPNGRSIFHFWPAGSLREHGVTEIQWESNEPPFPPSEDAEEGYTLDDFLELFPEGTYKAWGRTVEGVYLRNVTVLSHDLPAGPNVTSVAQGSNLTIMWDPVTKEFDPEDPQGQDGDAEDLDSEIVAYIVVAEYTLVLNVDMPDEEEITRALTIDVAADVFSADIPEDFLPAAPRDDDELEFKIEVAAVEESGNLTFTEIPICLEEGEFIICPPEDEE